MAGIGRIETKLKNRLEATDKNISAAFQDLSQLISMAQQMTKLSKSIASKIREHGSQVTTDETIQFKSLLLELGIEQQVDVGVASKSSYSDSSRYYLDLARQIASIVKPLMERHKRDQMSLSEVYCCFNRARGIELVSPDDILSACKQFQQLPELELRLVQYSSGLLVLQSGSCNDEVIIKKILELVEQAGCLTPLQLSARLSTSVQLCRQQLDMAEKAGDLCRDESLEGLKFYPNKFLRGGD